MRHLRTLGLCLIAVLAVSAVATASASAGLPEFGGCERVLPGHGKYSDGACTVKVTSVNKKTEGNYEWYTGKDFGWIAALEHTPWHAPRGLTEEVKLSSRLGATTFEASGGKKMECTGGEAEDLNLEDAHTSQFHGGLIALTGCESEGQPCYSLPYETVNNLDEQYYEGGFEGKLGYISGKGTEHPVVGLSLTTPKNEEGKYVPLFVANCAGKVGTIAIGGKQKKNEGNTVIAVITPVDEMVGVGKAVSGLTLTYSESHGLQEPPKFATGHNLLLQGEVEGAWQPLGLQAIMPLTWEPGAAQLDLEIKAIP